MRHWFLQLTFAFFFIGILSQIERPHLAGVIAPSINKTWVKSGSKDRKRKLLPRRHFFDDGRTENTAFELKLEPGKKLPLMLQHTAPRFVSFRVLFPSRIEFELSGPQSSPSLYFELRTQTSPSLTIATAPSVDTQKSRRVYRVSLTLSPGGYIFQIGNNSVTAKREHRNIKHLYSIRVVNVLNITQQLSLSKGNQTSDRLDIISRAFTRKIVVEKPIFVTFSITGAPKQKDPWNSLLINIKNADGSSVYAAESNDTEGKSLNTSFILSPRVYFLEVKVEPNQWPSPLLEETWRSIELTLRVGDVIDQTLPESMKALQSWIKDVGLDKLLEFEEFADLQNPRRGLPHANRRLGGLAAEVAIARAANNKLRLISDESARKAASEQYFLDRLQQHKEQENIEKQIASENNIIWPTELKEVERPRLIISFRPKKDRWEFRASERAFQKAHKISLWNRILQKVSALETISALKIVVFAPVWCDPHLVYIDDGYDAYRHGMTCLSASASTPLAATANVATSSVSSFRSPPRSLADVVPTFLSSFISSGKVDLDLLSAEPDFVEVIVRGVRGQVIRGGNEWERLQLTFIVSIGGKDRPPTLRVSLDGRLASGLGTYPKDSQFTRDMEPQFSMNMTEFAKKLANSLRDELLKTEKK